MLDPETPLGPSVPHYILQLATTSSGIGYFICVPEEERFFHEHLAMLQTRPLDEFLHKHLLESLSVLRPERIEELMRKADPTDDVLLALLYELCLLNERLQPLLASFEGLDIGRLAKHTPLIHIRSALLPKQDLHARWSSILGDNLLRYAPLPPPDETGLPLPYDAASAFAAARDVVPVSALTQTVSSVAESASHSPVPPLDEVAALALQRLEVIGAVAGPEMRHIASLSPYALFRQWHLDLKVENGRNNYTLTGIQTSYGRGLSLDRARASYAMEMVERISSFASFDAHGTIGYVHPHALVHERYSELAAAGRPVLDPNRLQLEVPYEDAPLFWLEAEEVSSPAGTDPRRVLIPAQCVFLFCNLDEPALFSGLGSTGLASGLTREQARVSALLEVLERDAEAVMPFDPRRVFRLTAEDPIVATLLADYAARGIQVYFQDITTSFGVPAYKCFVVGAQGEIIKGTGAHLDGRRAILSALTETPYPYPYGPPSGAFEGEWPERPYEILPDYSTEDAASDVILLETLLASNGYPPLYVDITRSDLDLPVVRAIVPGLEFMADFDCTSLVSRRLFANYLQMVG